MFRDCPFCGVQHRSPYVDELEEIVLACRAGADRQKLGLLADYEGHDTSPIKCEAEEVTRAAEQVRCDPLR
jgi:hypothetical protein